MPALHGSNLPAADYEMRTTLLRLASTFAQLNKVCLAGGAVKVVIIACVVKASTSSGKAEAWLVAAPLSSREVNAPKGRPTPQTEATPAASAAAALYTLRESQNPLTSVQSA